jgi:membrane protein DedA with SNARE-associated domain
MTQSFETTGRRLSRRWEYAIGALALMLVIGLAVLVALNWHDIGQITGYGYFGGFIMGVIGGATIPIPIPATAVYFALGGVLKPWLGPAALAPLMLGLVCGLGEALGAMSIYATGYSGTAVLAHRPVSDKPGRLQRLYLWLMSAMNRRGGWVLFAASAIINPFFYPVSLAAGVARMGWKRFFAICLAGKIIKCGYVAYAGYFGLRGLFQAFGINV